MAFIIRPRPVRLFHDFETKSRLDLTKVGSSRYSRDPSTRAQMLAWAFDDGDVSQWTEDDGEFPPNEITDAIEDDRIMKHAWNASFEKGIWQNVLGLPINHAAWTCTMTVAMSLALPGKLEVAGKIVRLDEDLLKVPGKVFINKFAKPRKPTKDKPWEWASSSNEPWDWLEYCHYNRQDVKAERAIWKKVRKYDFNETERALYELDQEINQAGIPINLNAVKKAIVIRDIAKAKLFGRMIEITGLANPNSGPQILPWLQANGYPFDDLKKGHIERALEKVQAEIAEAGENYRQSDEFQALLEYAEVLDLRAQVSKTSVTKFDALLRATDTDGNLRNTFQFAGAGRTSRWAGRIFQPQNLAKPTPELEKSVPMIAHHIEVLDPEEFMMLYGRPIDALSAAIRPMVQAGQDEETGEEMIFADSDLSAIENIVLGWSSGESKITSVFEQGRDPYLDFGRYMFETSYEALEAAFKAGDKTKRTTCKPGVLGCGYGLGKGAIFENEQTGELEATGLLGYAWGMKIKSFTLEQSEKSVNVWRSTFTKAVEFWGDLEDAAFRCMRTGKTTTAGPVEFRLETPFLRMYLPSGRAVSYLRPMIQQRMTSWGKKKATLTYEGMSTKKKWIREGTYGGKLTENVCQAIARDILGHGMLLAKDQGLDLRLTVHDQIVSRGHRSRADEDLQILKECMMAPPPWASDIPLNVGGFSSLLFVKD